MTPMTAERWRRVTEVLNAALEREPDDRESYLDQACEGDPELRREVDSLLAAHDEPGPMDALAEEIVSPLLSRLRSLPVRHGGTISHYRILGTLGMGGMGVVYRALDTRLNRPVALKFLPPHLGRDDGAKRRFLVEAQAAACLEHPNICTIYEVGETDGGELFIAMPLYEGKTLRERIERGPLPLEEAVDFGLQAARGLAKAHEREIVHRDIKPANLVVTADGVLKIVDWGIAKLADVQLTGPGMKPGTVAYMSPEQAAGEPVDCRSDLWSLGVVLYEMLTGQRPFRGEHDPVVLQAILHAEPEPVSALRPDIPVPLSRIVSRLLAKSAAERYATAAELAGALEGTNAPGTVHRDSAPGVSPAGVLPEGERRQATVLVSHLSGYAGLVERLKPDEIDRLTRRLRETSAEIVARHGGVVNRFRGDEMVLLFGIPAAHEDDCLRATRTAFELHERVRALSREVEERTGQPVRLHTGIDIGRVVAQPADGPQEQYRVTGTPTRVAAQLAIHAAAGEVWVTPECQRLIGPFFATEARDPLTTGDAAPPLTPHRVRGESGLQTRLEAAERGGLTAYTGRQEELATLHRALQSALRGEGRFVTIVGEAGLGKSRLLYEFRHSTDQTATQLFQGRCQSDGSGAAYLPFIEVLRSVLRLDGAGGSQAEQIASRIREIGPELEEFIPLYLHLLSVQSDAFPAPTHLRGEQFRLAMRDALAAILTLGTRRRPTILLLEDWHWADEASHATLTQVAEMVSAYPLLVVVTHRPNAELSWGQPSHHTAIPLRPLDASASAAMLASVLRAETLPERLGALLHERTGGNPFFLEEISQALLEEGVLRVEESRISLSGALDTLDLPDTVQAVIRTRLDHLDRDAREVLRLASVVGREFTRAVLEQTLGRAGRLPNALQTLKHAALIQQTRVVPEAAYRFKHVLTQEVAYASLLEHQRQALHGQVGEAIERLYGDNLGEQLDRLAHHFSRAETWDKAVRYGIRAAERADALAQFSEALGILERVEQWLGRLPDDSGRRITRADVLLSQERLCETLGLRARQQGIIDELISLLEPGSDRAKLAEAYVRQGDLYTLLRRFDAAEEALNRSLRIRRELGDAVGEGNSLRSLGLMRWHEGKNEEALAYVEAALALDRRRNDVEAVLGDLSNLGYVLKGMGEYDRARTYLEEALELHKHLPEFRPDLQGNLKQSYILHNLANVYRALGDNERALDYIRQAKQFTTEHRLPIQLSYHFTAEAHLALQQGWVEESLALYCEAVELTRRANFAPGLAQSLRFLGEVLIGLDRHQEALPHLQEAAALFAQLKDPGAEALMWSGVAAVHERADRHADALAAWGKTRTLRKQAGDAAGELAALEGLGRVTRRHVLEPSLALGYFREALLLAGQLRDRATEGRLRNTIGILQWSGGEYAAALDEYERALDLFRELGDEANAGLIENSIAVTLKTLGRRREAAARLEEALAHHRRAEQPLLEGHALAVLGDLRAETGDAEGALASYEDSLRIRRQIGDRRGQGWMLHGIARVELSRGLAVRARERIAEASQIAGELGDGELREACDRLRRTPGG